MNKFIWAVSQWTKNLGWPGMAGVLLLVISVAGYVSISFWEKSSIEKLTQDEANERKRLEKSRLNPAGEATSPGAQLRAFYEFFPGRQKAPGLLKAIYGAAHEESINLAQGDYKFKPGKSGQIGSYQVNLPVKGSYIQIRKFIVKVLNSMPSAALEEVSFKREAISKGELEAKVRFSIYLNALR